MNIDDPKLTAYALDELDDVTNTHVNFDIPEELLGQKP